MKMFIQDPVEMHGPVTETKQSTVLEGSGVLEATWHSQGFAVKFCSKEEMLKEIPRLPL